MRAEQEIRNAIDRLKTEQSYWQKCSAEYNKYALMINLLKWTLGEKKSFY